MELCIHRTPEQIAHSVTCLILKQARRAIEKSGQFKLVLAGGTTPNLIYQFLAQVQAADWQNWWIFWGDERCLPSEHNERNSLVAHQLWLDKVAIPRAQIFVIPAELGAEAAATAYRSVVAQYSPFDMVLLGMGEDGHTASLFPGHQHPLDELVHAVYNSPKPPSERVSLSAAALSNADTVSILVSGQAKRAAFEAWQNKADLPVAHIRTLRKLEAYIDEPIFEGTELHEFVKCVAMPFPEGYPF